MRTDDEDQLREALASFAQCVLPADDAYGRVQAQWRWREARRKAVVAAVVLVLVAVLTAVSIWALSGERPGPNPMFGDTPTATITSRPPAPSGWNPP